MDGQSGQYSGDYRSDISHSRGCRSFPITTFAPTMSFSLTNNRMNQ
jgi:hypothetical protein